jgi:uncharacterized membrane protein (UPF0127 family)
MRALLPILLLLAACNRAEQRDVRAAEAVLPPTDDEMISIPADASPETVLATVDAGLQLEQRRQAALTGASVLGKGPSDYYFVVVRAGDRHGTGYRDHMFHVLIGAGVRLPAGSMRIRRNWSVPGHVDGNNEQPQTWGISLGVEAGASLPFAPEVERAARLFCLALAERIDLHPDCVIAMGDVPYVRPYAGEESERRLAASARADLPLPAIDGELTISSGERRIPVSYELRDNTAGIRVGMMLRRSFDGDDRGMLFRYKHRAVRRFWNKNVFIPIDLAYIRKGVIEQIVTMRPEAGVPQSEIPFYESVTPVRHALEMRGGWFEAQGIKVGDRVDLPE